MTDQTANPALSISADTHTPFQATASVVGDAHRVVYGGSEAITDRNLGFATQSPSLAAAPTDILSTARSPMGSPLAGRDIKPTSVVTVPGGFETSVAVAVNMGHLRQNAMGFYEEAGKPAAVSTTTTPLEGDQKALEDALKADREQAAKSSTPEATAVPDLAPEFHGYAEEFNAKADMMTHESIVRGLINTGEVSQHDLEAVATQLGIEPNEAQRRITATHQAFIDQAVTLAGPAGYDAIMWAKDNTPGLLKQAADQHVYHSNPAAYDQVVNTYAERVVDTDPQRILTSPVAQQYGIRRESDGRITVQHPTAGRIEWKAGIKSGLLNIGRR